MGVGSQHHAPAALPPRKTKCPLFRWLSVGDGNKENRHTGSAKKRVHFNERNLLKCV
jgi:hypothetical protein